MPAGPIMLDLKGPQLRLHTDQNYGIENGEEFPIYFSNGPIKLNYDLSDVLAVGDAVLIENGFIRTKIVDKDPDKCVVKIIFTAEKIIHDNMGVNLPGIRLDSLPVMTKKINKRSNWEF